ncbi:MAG: hypothetical protein QXG12_06495 [Thermoproteota archaeon]
MPFLGAVIAAIASAIGSIISFIAGIVASIVSAIASIISTIIAGIASAISFVVSMIKTGVGSVLSKISNALNIFSFIKDTATAVSKKMELFKLTGLISEVVNVISSVVNRIKNFVSIIFKPISESIRVVFFQVYYIWEKLFAPIKEIIYKLKDIYVRIRQGIIGRVLQKVKQISDFIALIHTLSRVYVYIKEGKYIQAIFLLAYHFDEALRNEVKAVVESISSDISDVIVETRRLFYFLKADVDGVSRYTYSLGIVIEDIGKNLGLKSIVELGKYLKENVVNELRKLKDDISKVYSETIRAIFDVTNPFIQTLNWIHAYEREELRWKKLYRYLTLEHLHAELALPRFDPKWYLYRVIP